MFGKRRPLPEGSDPIALYHFTDAEVIEALVAFRPAVMTSVPPHHVVQLTVQRGGSDGLITTLRIFAQPTPTPLKPNGQ